MVCFRIVLMSLALILTSCGRDDDRKSKDGGAADESLDDETDGGNLTPHPSDVPAGGNEAVSRFRGIVKIDSILHERLIANRDSAFFFGSYLGGYSAQYLYGLPQLLGYSEGNGLTSE